MGEPESVEVALALIRHQGRWLVSRRASGRTFAGMWEFPNGRVDGDPVKGLPNALKMGYKLRVKMKHRTSPSAPLPARTPGLHRAKGLLGIVEHGYSHFSVTVHVFRCELVSLSKETNLKWVSLKELDSYPMGKIDRQIAKMITT